LPDGRIECLGRIDQQVKIRGFRVELGEIEAVLQQCPGVLEAAVILREDTPGDQRLVAYVRPSVARDFSVDPLKVVLQSKLPEFMVPAAFVVIQEFPLTPNGKLNRKALPAPVRDSNGSSVHEVPSNEIEAMICSIWQNVLGVTEVGTRENFFDIGGHSLLVVQVLAQLRKKVSQPLQVTDLFRYSTIEALAQFIGAGSEKTTAGERGRLRAEARRSAMERRAGKYRE
jgi:acyl carrier protein